jgi:hypothetical protein
MNTLSKLFSIAALSLLASTSAVWATGTLAITAVQQVGTMVKVTGTCVQGAGTVKVWFKETTTAAQIKVFTSTGTCGVKASTIGRTVKFSVATVPSGVYSVYLKQAGALAGPAGNVIIP